MSKLKKLYILCTLKISSIIETYFKLLSKSKYCEFINLTDFDDKIQNNAIFDVEEKNHTNIIIMHYISQ